MNVIILALLPITAYTIESIRCVNFYGIETVRKAPVCDWEHEPRWYLQQLKDGYGLNTVRIPYSGEYASGDDFSQMDALIKTCNDMGLKVVLDYHRTYATHQGSVPTERITLGTFLDIHLNLLTRYQDQVWGVSIFNEFQVTDSNFANSINHMTVNAIESQFPGKYQYFIGCPDWGHDCSHVTIPTGLENRTYVDIHQYAFTDNPTIRDTVFPDRIPAENWFVGEIGCKSEELPWLRSYLEYLKRRGIANLCYWTIANSWDTGGLWQDDCRTIEQAKVDLLAQFYKHRRRLRYIEL